MTDLAMKKAERDISSAQRRADRIRRGINSFVETRREIAAAYADRDWYTLGYASFDAYVDSEFSEVRLRLSPDERREAVTALRKEGMSQRGIASVLGVSQPTVRRDLESTESNDSVPGRITGLDGREQPASRPSPKPARSRSATEETSSEADLEDPQTPGPAADPSAAQAGPGPTDEPVSEVSDTDPEPDMPTTTPPAPNFADLDDQLNAEMEGTDQRFRRNFSSALVKAVAIWQFDIDRIAQAYATDYEQAIRPHLDEMERWCARVREARRQATALRVVPGGAR